jgi:hypothetical protein
MEVWEGILRMPEDEDRGFMALTDLTRVHIDILLENVLSVLVISGCNILVNYLPISEEKALLQLLIQSFYSTCQGHFVISGCVPDKEYTGAKKTAGRTAHVIARHRIRMVTVVGTRGVGRGSVGRHSVYYSQQRYARINRCLCDTAG